MPAQVYVFVSPRGGVGKSTASANLATSLAVSAPSKKVLLVDFSIQASSSYQVFGGLEAPKEDTAEFSHGAELVARVPEVRHAFGLLTAAKAHGPGMFSAAPAFPVEKHCVNVAKEYPAGGCPGNLFLAPGGTTLAPSRFTELTSANVSAYAKKLKQAFNSLSNDWIVIIEHGRGAVRAHAVTMRLRVRGQGGHRDLQLVGRLAAKLHGPLE
jgi:hypothetical protein